MFDRTLGPARDPGFKTLLESARTGRVFVDVRRLSGGSGARLLAAPMLLDAFGPERLMWGSDWPHTDTDLNRVTTYPITLEDIRGLGAGIRRHGARS